LVELMVAYSNPTGITHRLREALSLALSSPRTKKHARRYQYQKRLIEPQIKLLIDDYLAGAQVKTLAKSYGVHRTTVTNTLIKYGVTLRQVGLTKQQVSEACALYPAGWSLARLAERYDVDDMTVRRYLLLEGVTMRSPHERPK
jgi:hypothetical protein